MFQVCLHGQRLVGKPFHFLALMVHEGGREGSALVLYESSEVFCKLKSGVEAFLVFFSPIMTTSSSGLFKGEHEQTHCV